MSEQEGTEYHERACEKVEFFKDFWKPNSSRKSGPKKEPILKMIIEAAILCVEQEFTLRGHRDHAKSASDDDCDNMKKVHQGNFLAIVNTFAKFDTILKESIEQGFRNAEFLSWDIQNDIISCKGAYFRINVLCNSDEVTER